LTWYLAPLRRVPPTARFRRFIEERVARRPSDAPGHRRRRLAVGTSAGGWRDVIADACRTLSAATSTRSSPASRWRPRRFSGRPPPRSRSAWSWSRRRPGAAGALDAAALTLFPDRVGRDGHARAMPASRPDSAARYQRRALVGNSAPIIAQVADRRRATAGGVADDTSQAPGSFRLALPSIALRSSIAFSSRAR